MAKITKRIQLGVTAEQSERLRVEAKRQNISVSALVRVAIARHLNALSQQKYTKASRLNTPVAFWTYAEKKYADKVLQRHFTEDR